MNEVVRRARILVSVAVFLAVASTPAVHRGVWAQEAPDRPAADGGTGDRPDWIQPLDVKPEPHPDWVGPPSTDSPAERLPEQAQTVYWAEAYSLSEAHKMRALESLEELSRRGELMPEDDAVSDVLAFLVLERLDHPIRRAGEIINDFPMVRISALELLAAVGGEQAEATVRSVVLREPERSMVLPTAVAQVARLDMVLDEDVSRRLLSLIEGMGVGTPDSRLAMAIVNAIYVSHQRQWGSVSVDLYRALFEIVRGPYAPATRARAREVIEAMRQ